MKVLWFSPTPCGSLRKNSNQVISGGWLISLEGLLKRQPDIELSVAFFAKQWESPFSYDGVVYYTMGYKKQNAMRRVLNRLRSVESIDRIRLPWMMEVINLCKPDVIHIHGSEESFITILPKISGYPVIVSIQGMIAPLCEKFFSGVSKKDAYKFDSWSDRIHLTSICRIWKSSQQKAKRENKYLSLAPNIIGRTFWDYNCTLAVNPNRKYYLVNEVLRDSFYEKTWKGQMSHETIQIISTISGGIYKGYETVLKVARILLGKSPVKFEWHIVGYGESSKWVRIAESITHINHSEHNIILHGRLDENELSDLLCKSDIYVHVSHMENSPNSVCEAMLLGMPIIATYAGGTASLLSHEEEGLLVQDGDPYVIAGGIINMMKNPDLAIKYGGLARKRALQRHDKKEIVNTLIQCYQDVWSSSKG